MYSSVCFRMNTVRLLKIICPSIAISLGSNKLSVAYDKRASLHSVYIKCCSFIYSFCWIFVSVSDVTTRPKGDKVPHKQQMKFFGKVQYLFSPLVYKHHGNFLLQATQKGLPNLFSFSIKNNLLLIIPSFHTRSH